MLPQNLAAEWIDLAEGDSLEPARPFKAKGETADAAEQVQKAIGHLLFVHERASAVNARFNLANPLTSRVSTTLNLHGQFRLQSGNVGL